MTRLVRDQPLKTREPLLPIDAGLPVGTHRFQLQVVTADGRISQPTLATVRVAIRIPGR